MITKEEIRFAESLLRYGNIERTHEWEDKDGCYRAFIITDEDSEWYLVKHNGEIVYLKER